jgi:SAM-dependent methyltransferase
MTLPQRAVRLITSLIVARPRLWRVFRAALRLYFTVLAPRWDRIVAAGDLEALAAALAGVPPPRRALDVGTGTGAAALLVAARFPGAEVTGVDVSPAMIEAARAKTPPTPAARVRFATADASRLPFASGSFELVTLANAIPFFDELARVLAPGGTLLVSFSEGAETPIWVPPERLRRELAGRGFTHVRELAAGAAMCLVARRGCSPGSRRGDGVRRLRRERIAGATWFV